MNIGLRNIILMQIIQYTGITTRTEAQKGSDVRTAEAGSLCVPSAGFCISPLDKAAPPNRQERIETLEDLNVAAG